MTRHGPSLVSTERAKWLGAAGIGAAALYGVDPGTHQVPLCPFHAMTGLWCPFCGSTRAAHALLHLQFGTALRDNVLLLVADPLGLYLAALWLTGRRLPASPPQSMRWLIVAVLLGFGVLRNLSVGSWLAPPA